MARRGLRYTGDGGAFFLTSAGRWNGAQFAQTNAPVATLRNQQCRKVIYYFETINATTEETTFNGRYEMLILTKAAFDALAVGSALPATADVKGTPFRALESGETARLVLKIGEDPLASIQKGD